MTTAARRRGAVPPLLGLALFGCAMAWCLPAFLVTGFLRGAGQARVQPDDELAAARRRRRAR